MAKKQQGRSGFGPTKMIARERTRTSNLMILSHVPLPIGLHERERLENNLETPRKALQETTGQV